ncbi:MAG: collagen binding domain-containing protein, partial [Myxococcales bacterium]
IARFDLPQFRQQSTTGNTELRYALSREWSLRTGAAVGRFTGRAPMPDVNSLTVPLGATWERGHTSVAALLRYQLNTSTNAGGAGGRLSARKRISRVSVSGYLDYQRDAATVELVLREDPALGRALAEMQLTAQSPDDIARVLRDNARLVELGYLDGANVSLHPSRLMAGGELGWASEDDARQQLKLRVLYDRTRTVTRTRHTGLSSVSYARRVAGPFDATGSFTWWANVRGDEAVQNWAWGVGLRMRLDDVPGAGLLPNGDLSGTVFRDDEGTGRYRTELPRVEGARVRIDGVHLVATDADGRFRFPVADNEQHRVELLLPAGAGAYFTTRSNLMLRRGEEASFGVAWSPARLSGVVMDDEGVGIVGVVVRLHGSERTTRGVTDSGGRFSFAVAEGGYVVTVQPDSFPAGYDVGSLEDVSVHLTRATPARVEFSVPANRTLAGRVVGRGRGLEVRLVESGQRLKPGKDGRFVFRGLKPGRYTVAASSGSRAAQREVQVPSGPATVRDVELTLP